MAGKKYKVDADNTLAFTQIAAPIVRILELAPSELNLYSFYAGSNYKIKTASNTLTLTDTLETNTVINEAYIDPITFTQDVTSTNAKYLSATNTIVLEQTTVRNIFAGIAEGTLSFGQTIDARKPIIVSASTDIDNPIDEIDTNIDPTNTEDYNEYLATIGLRQDLSVQLINNESVTSYLQLEQTVKRDIPGTAFNHIHLSDLAESTEYGSVTNVLQLVQTILLDSVNFAESELVLTQLAESVDVADRSFINDLDLNSIVTFYRG